jgi:ATP-dependent exoDNAse (exonuclease V) alpha subunit
LDTGVHPALARSPCFQPFRLVAIYYLSVKIFGRGSGSSGVSAAAYRAGERIRDERTGKTFDHAHRTDVMHKEIVLPSRFAAADMRNYQDRAWLWNAVELAETRANAAIAREYLVALPHELDHVRRVALAQNFARELADRHVFAVDLVIHAPRTQGDPRNFHAHLLTTRREVSPAGLGTRIVMDQSWELRKSAPGVNNGIEDLYRVRERWATLTNQALRDANVSAYVDHRSLQAQGIDREPLPRIPTGAFYAERCGERSEIAERIREAYRARVAARLERAKARAAHLGGEYRLGELRHLARQSWLQLRRAAEPSRARTPSAALGQAQGDVQEAARAGKEHADDYGL